MLYLNLKGFSMNFIKIVIPLFTASMVWGAPISSVYVQNCKTCHGPTGENTAVGKSKIIKDLSVTEIEKALGDLSSGERKGLPVAKMIKKNFMNTHTKEQIHELAVYINSL
jgi:cytochrome c553